jgi:ABC-type oligopeptide transport system ATPase subunit
MQMIFQDPYGSLNPRPDHRLDHRRRPYDIQKIDPRRVVVGRPSRSLMERVGLNPEHYNRYPQRVLRRAAPAHRDRPGHRAQA